MMNRKIGKIMICMVCIATYLFTLAPSVFADENVKGAETTFFVATNGNDANPGTKNAPFQTLEAARDAIRQLKSSSGLPKGGVKVFIRGGEYRFDNTFLLEQQDSGEPGKPIVYAAFPGERVQFIGGASLPANMFAPVTDEGIRERLPADSRDAIVQLHLPDLGITDYGQIRQGGFGPFDNIANPELFFNEQSLQLSRYPNSDYVKIGKVTVLGGNPRNNAPDTPGGSDAKVQEEFLKGHTFVYNDPRPNNWVDTGDIWLSGYFYWDWADGNLNVSSIDKTNNTISTKTASYYGIRSGQRYYYYNILEEIDQPGEWYLDRSTGMLYLYPPSDISQAKIVLSLMDEPLIKLQGASFINFEKLDLGYTRGSAIEIVDGTDNLISGCTIVQTGGFAVVIGDRKTGTQGGTNNGVISSTIVDTGIGGIYLAGGDRVSLTPGNNYAVNNEISRFSRLKKTYSPAVELFGVGNKVANNYIHDAPHMAIFIHGNNHLIEKNEIYNVLTETGDAGAIYMGRDWTEQGNVIRYNYLHKLRNSSANDQIGVYLDDMASGTTVYANLFDDVYRPVLVGGGRNNVIDHNIMLNSVRSIFADERGLNWAAYHAEPGGTLRVKLAQIPYSTPPWSTTYPNLVNILEDWPAAPKYNEITNNLIYNTSKDMEIAPTVSTYGKIENNYFIQNGQKLPGNAGSSFSETVQVFGDGKAGLYTDKYRKNVVSNNNHSLVKLMEDLKQ
ncbi:right-handed parallel beta-helix repeat-containing protein [Paenibacillus sp. KQZ6P-2]|uniref:Right-handed parallel beta-helix repeat-containing protein n=1 Tax=Paenibacillus mangrovi TaxID=2931978 RepID=A0A9X1WQI5_9BACL|nr:right-handed parallel beta-helix repeat-containing protein [Paenibacillus mangrovi]MCJ8013224.1 right-handed parallel beta-helix repeat-containing protein [Paenibacillus mangrovi]